MIGQSLQPYRLPDLFGFCVPEKLGHLANISATCHIYIKLQKWLTGVKGYGTWRGSEYVAPSTGYKETATKQIINTLGIHT